MTGQINLVPETLDLEMYAGDGFAFKIICTDSANAPIDIRGTVRAQVRLDRLTPSDPPIASFSVVMTDAYQGIVQLSLSGDQTQTLSDHPSSKKGKFVGVWDLEWTSDEGEPRTICQGNVECVADVTR